MSKQFTCAREGCENQATRKTHNQKYCSDECCRLATNSRIMENYYRRRDQRQGKPRFCTVCESTKLNRYNDSQICASCKTKREIEVNNSVVDMLNNTSLTA